MFQVKSQIGHGGLPVKGLGTVKSSSGELDKSQNLRSGYKFTWHESETEPLCTSEVVGGEQCSVSLGNHTLHALAELDSGAVVGADSTKLSCDDGFDIVDHSCEKDTRGGRGELSSFVTQKSIDKVQNLTSNIQTTSYPTQRVQALQDTTGPGVTGGDHGTCS